MKLIKAVRGTKDIYGEEAVKYTYISKMAQEVFENYGYTYIKTPIFEETDLFKRGIGEGTDVVEKEMYTFKDRGERSITLRPENTASVVRSYLENGIYGKEDVTRYYYNGSMFRYERPQAGRQREFNQIGVEVLGESSPILDAEVIAMSFTLLEKLGISDLEVHINSVGTTASRIQYREKLLNFLNPIKEELCEDCQMRMEKNPLRVLDCKIDKCKELTKDAPSIIDSLTEEELALIDEASAIPAETWFALSRWAKETKNFQPWQRSLLFSVGTLAARGQKPSIKQATHAVKAYQAALQKGFTI